MSRVVRKPDFCICENKDADQLRGNREADQRLCFRYTDSTIPLLPKYGIPSLLPSCVAVQPGLCRTWSETPKTGFLTTRLNIFQEVCDLQPGYDRPLTIDHDSTIYHWWLGCLRAYQQAYVIDILVVATVD